MRIGAACTATVICCAGVVGPASAASATSSEALETSTALPFGSIGDMAVDTEAGYVFVSGGSASTYIEVLNLAGQIVGQIQDQDGATGLVLSSDGGTLYAADSATDSISAIDTSTLTQTTSYAADGATAYLALSGGNLWFTTSSDEYIHEVALSTGTVSTTSTSTTYYGSLLTASSAAPDVLVSGTPGLSPATVDVFTVASGTPVYSAGGALVSVDGTDCANLRSMAIVPDGESLDLACGAPYEGFQLSLSTMTSVQQNYDSGAYPASIAVSPDGETLVGIDGTVGDDSVFEFNPSSSTSVGSFAVPEGDGADTSFVSWGADDSVAYAITQGGVSAPSSFETFHFLGSVSLSLSVPAVTSPNSTFTVSGRLTDNGSALAGTQVAVTRVEAGATSTVGTFTTDANGDFSFTDSSPALLTTAAYTASVVGVTPAMSTSGSVTTIPVAYPLTTRRPVTAPVKTTATTKPVKVVKAKAVRPVHHR